MDQFPSRSQALTLIPRLNHPKCEEAFKRVRESIRERVSGEKTIFSFFFYL